MYVYISNARYHIEHKELLQFTFVNCTYNCNYNLMLCHTLIKTDINSNLMRIFNINTWKIWAIHSRQSL